VFVVVFAHKSVACAGLDEAAIQVARCVGKMFPGFQGWCEPVGL